MWKVGFLYRFYFLLEFLKDSSFGLEQLKQDLPIFHGVKIEGLIELGLKGKWIDITNNNEFVLTKSGEELLKISSATHRLRVQIRTLIDIINPPWVIGFIHGRSAFKLYAPPDVLQCFNEAELFESLDPKIINWWDQITARYKNDEDCINTKYERLGEKLSFEYELYRTGTPPNWVAIEFAGTGYDFVSQYSATITSRILIKVKTSRKQWNCAKFCLSKKEWEILSNNKTSILHLWCLSENQKSPIIVPCTKLIQFIGSKPTVCQLETSNFLFSDVSSIKQFEESLAKTSNRVGQFSTDNALIDAANKIEIYKIFINAAVKMQGLSAIIDSKEDSRNKFLANEFSLDKYYIKDQPHWGRSATGKSIGRPDIKVEDDNGNTLAICEALILKSMNCSYIDKHVKKLFRYDLSGLESNFIIVYSEANDFLSLWHKYLSHIHEIDLEYPIIGEIQEVSTGYGEIRLAISQHNRQGTTSNLYHLFINMKS